MSHLKGRALCINMVGYLGPLTIAIAGDSTVSTSSLLLETMWYCTSFLGREVARHPPAPRTRHGGGVAAHRKICRARFPISSVRQVLRPRCDARVFKRPAIEIIARQKVAPAFEPKKIGMDGWLELLSTIEKGSETGPPDRGCRILFSELQPDRRKWDERKEVGRDLL
jgi:hypothetical protein